MSEMIEKIAKAMFIARFPFDASIGQPDPADFWPNDIASVGMPQAESYRDMARAALQAMRDPPQCILNSMWRRNDDNDSEQSTLDNWRDAIDTALGKITF